MERPLRWIRATIGETGARDRRAGCGRYALAMRPLAGTVTARPTDGPPWQDRCFVAIAALSLALKLALALAAAGIPPVLDEKSYLTLAEGLAAGEGWSSTFRPPLYGAVLAGVLAAGGSPDALRLIQAVLATLCLLPVYSLAHGIGGRATARIAAGLVAVDPVLNGFSHLLWTETVYLALFLPGLALLVRDPHCDRGGRWLGAGLLLGLASLARAQLLTFAPLLVLWAWWGRDASRSWLRGAALLTLGWCLVVLPWSGRNLLVTGDFFLVDTNGAYNLLVGSDPRAQFVDKDDAWSDAWGSLDGEVYVQAAARAPGETQRRALALAGARIAADLPRFVSKSLWEAAHLLTLDDFIARHLRNGWYGSGAPAWLTPAYAVGAALFTALLLLAGGLGLTALPPSPFRRLAALALIHALLVFGLVYSLSRYAVPLRPLFAIAAAWLATHAVTVRAGLGARPVRRAAAALLLLALLLSWSRDLPLLTDMVRSGGSSHRFLNLR